MGSEPLCIPSTTGSQLVFAGWVFAVNGMEHSFIMPVCMKCACRVTGAVLDAVDSMGKKQSKFLSCDCFALKTDNTLLHVLGCGYSFR